MKAILAACAVCSLLTITSESRAGPGVPSPIKKIYVVSHAHLDIGYTDPPFTVAQSYKAKIDNQISYARTRPDYRWCVESTWQLDEWMKRSNQAQIDELAALVRDRRFGVAAGHSTMRSQKVGVEEMNRLLGRAQQWRNQYGWRIETLFQDDVPSIQWAYPQVLAKSGVKYVISGQNHFIGGGINQPYTSYLFRWQGPDGSRVLTWSARGGFTEGYNKYGIPWFSASSTIDATALATALNRLESEAYPYDAVLVQYAFDNGVNRKAYNAINTWNANNDNPKFLMALPEDFFEYMLSKYSAVIPLRQGNWVSNWDYLAQSHPSSEKIAKNAQHLLPVAESAAAIACALGVGAYPRVEIDNAWEHVLIIDEHTGAGVSNGTDQEISDSIDQYWSYATEILESTGSALTAALVSLLTEAADPSYESIVVLNPLSWVRTGLVRVDPTAGLSAGTVTLTDTVTGHNVPYQTDAAATQTLFVASAVPACGYKRFRISSAIPSSPSSSLLVSGNIIQNAKYTIEIDSNGYISSLYDRIQSRELVDIADDDDFNRLCPATHSEGFSGKHHAQPNPAVTHITPGQTGPVCASLRIANSDHPLALARIILYEDLDRIDIVNQINRNNLESPPGYCAVSFPLNLAGADVRIDTPAGWHNPAHTYETLSGASTRAYGIDHCLDLSLPDYGVTFATPDVYIHAFGDLQTPGGVYPPTRTSIFSDFIRTRDIDVERDAGPILEIAYSFRPHASGFDAVREAQFGREICMPMQGRVVPATSGRSLGADSLSFFSLDVENVVITSIKKADYGPGLIVKLQEIAGHDDTVVTLSSALFGFYAVTRTTPLETDEEVLMISPDGSGSSVSTTMGHNEILPLRIEAEPRPTPSHAFLLIIR